MSHVKHIETGRPARHGQLILERRVSLAKRVLPNLTGSELLLDVGCGNGAQTILLAPLVKKIIGCDIISLSHSEQGDSSESFTFLRCDAGYIPLRSGSVSTATSFEVLEHVPDDRQVISEVARVLIRGGYFLFSVPNKWWIFESHGAHLSGFNWIPWNRVPFVGWLPRPIHERIAKARIYTMSRALRLAESANLQPISSGYITAPLDVLPPGRIRDALRRGLFQGDTTPMPFLAVNLYVCCRKR